MVTRLPRPSRSSGYVSQLRKALGGRRARGEAEHVLVTRSPGYLLRVEPDELDAERFERVVEDGRRALGAGNPQLATRTLLEALSLWRGPALADFTHDSFAQNEIARLEEARVSALEERIEADLALGRHAELVGELESLVAVHPLRERLRGQLMLALYRSGRQAEALAAYQAARRQLDEELGLEPNESLQRLERAILVHDQRSIRLLARRPRRSTGTGVTLACPRARSLCCSRMWRGRRSFSASLATPTRNWWRGTGRCWKRRSPRTTELSSTAKPSPSSSPSGEPVTRFGPP